MTILTLEAGETFREAQQLDTASYRNADSEEIENARKELEEEKKAKEGYVYKTSKARVQHSDKVIRGMDTAVSQPLNLARNDSANNTDQYRSKSSSILAILRAYASLLVQATRITQSFRQHTPPRPSHSSKDP
jgi:hypothetical protein